MKKFLFHLILVFATLFSSAHAQIRHLNFTHNTEPLPYAFQRSRPSDPYLAELRKTYELDSVVAGKKDDYAKVRAVSRWVRSRWEHNGSNEPLKSDPISILHEAAQGKHFRCVEYSIVLAAALQSLSIPARVLNLKTEDAETRESGAGHVVTEAYLADQAKWIMVDGQWDTIPTLNGKPLNAVELQNALAKNAKGLNVDSFSGSTASEYFPWVSPYLFYFDTAFDGRYPATKGGYSLMLVPVGTKQITVFQRKWDLKNFVYTHSARVFYAAP